MGSSGITPFNFPAMIPLWMFPLALTTGNTFVMKPSEVDPGCPIRLCELAMEAGVPAGVLNVIHGTHDAVNFLCDEPRIKGVSFVFCKFRTKAVFKPAHLLHASEPGSGPQMIHCQLCFSNVFPDEMGFKCRVQHLCQIDRTFLPETFLAEMLRH